MNTEEARGIADSIPIEEYSTVPFLNLDALLIVIGR